LLVPWQVRRRQAVNARWREQVALEKIDADLAQPFVLGDGLDVLGD
jgi:hypothetical protein